MTVSNEPEEWHSQVDTALKEWRQGDCVLGEHLFVLRFDPQRPLTPETKEFAKDEFDLAEVEVKGLVVVTQTCDIVRECSKRPFVEVVPLVEANEQQQLALDDVKRGIRPRYAFIPGVAEHNLVADLDRVMTVEKTVVAGWERQPGCSNDQDIRTLGQALARKRARFAFPDDFNTFVYRLQQRLKKKHEKDSSEGEALRALLEIRVRADPSWADSNIELMFWFIRDENQFNFQGKGWDELLDQWLDLIPESGRFQSVNGLVTTLEDMTAKEYNESDRLDLDHLSLPK